MRRNSGLPEIAGRPVYDTPIAAAEPNVQRVWSRTQEILSTRLAAPTGDSLAEYHQWATETMAPWLQNRVNKLLALATESKQLAKEHRNQLFAAITMATVYDDTLQQLQTKLLPAQLLAGNLEDVMRSAFNERLGTLARRARSAYQQCAGRAGQAPPELQRWQPFCSQRADELATLADLLPRKSARRNPPPKLPAECEGDTVWSDPQAPAPDESAARRVAVLYSGHEVTGKDRDRLLSAVAHKLRKAIKAQLVPASAVNEAERLHEQRRLRSTGPVCGQAPPLLAILSDKFPNPVLARVMTTCATPLRSLGDPRPTGKGKTCKLEVLFDRPGTNDSTNLPSRLAADLDAPPISAAAWIAAAPRLGTAKGTGIFAAMGGFSYGSSVFRVFGHNQYDPWLRIAPTLYDLKGELLRCHEKKGVTSLEVSWVISPVGKPSKVLTKARTVAADTDGDEVSNCVSQVLKNSAWPCTQTKKPESVKVRMCLGR